MPCCHHPPNSSSLPGHPLPHTTSGFLTLCVCWGAQIFSARPGLILQGVCVCVCVCVFASQALNAANTLKCSVTPSCEPCNQHLFACSTHFLGHANDRFNSSPCRELKIVRSGESRRKEVLLYLSGTSTRASLSSLVHRPAKLGVFSTDVGRECCQDEMVFSCF